MQERRFSRKCAECHQRTMNLASVPYSVQIDHDGRKYQVAIPDFVVPTCSNCGAVSIDAPAAEIIDAKLREQAGLLKAREIREFRIKLRLDQKELAERLGVAPATLSRWETGAQIQQRSLDRFMRLFFLSEHARRLLGDEARLANSGVAFETPTNTISTTAPVTVNQGGVIVWTEDGTTIVIGNAPLVKGEFVVEGENRLNLLPQITRAI